MKTKILGPKPKEVMALFSKYLDKGAQLNDRERAAYCHYFEHLASPLIVAGPSIDINKWNKQYE